MSSLRINHFHFIFSVALLLFFAGCFSICDARPDGHFCVIHPQPYWRINGSSQNPSRVPVGNDVTITWKIEAFPGHYSDKENRNQRISNWGINGYGAMPDEGKTFDYVETFRARTGPATTFRLKTTYYPDPCDDGRRKNGPGPPMMYHSIVTGPSPPNKPDDPPQSSPPDGGSPGGGSPGGGSPGGGSPGGGSPGGGSPGGGSPGGGSPGGGSPGGGSPNPPELPSDPCNIPFVPESCPPYLNPDVRSPENLPPPTQIEFVAENIEFNHSKQGYLAYSHRNVRPQIPKYFLQEMVTTSLQGGTPENPVGGTLVTQICQMTGTEVTVVKQGNPSWYGGSASGPVTETSHSGSITVNSYDDCPNREPDEPATMIFESTLSTEYTKLNMRSDTFQNAWSFKGVGYYRQQTVTAELLIDKHEETISFQKTKYKVRIPPDLPRPYTINWLEVFTPEDENPDDLIEPQITVKAKSAVIQGAESQEFTIDPSTTPDKEGSWSLLPVEIIPNPLPLDGVARMKIDLGSNNFADLPEENMPKITIGGEICDEVVQDKETLSIFYFTPPSKSEADVFDLVISGITVPNYPYLSNGKPLKLLKIVSYTDDLDQGTEGIFNSILVSIDEAKSRALRPIQEEQSFTVSVVDRFMNRMTHVANTGTGMAKEFYSDKSIGVSIEAKINSLVSKCNARNEKVILELDDGGVIAVATATARASAAAAGPVFGSKTFFSDVKTLLLTNGKKIYQGIYGSARFAVINADDFDYTAWTATIANQNIFSAVAKNPDAKIIINGALFNYKSEPNVTTGMVYSNGLKLATSVGPSHKGYKTAELRYWFGQNVDNTPAANGGKAASFKFGGKGHPPVPATPGATDLHSATGGLLSLIWPDATGVRQKVTVAMDMDLKIYTGFTGPMYGHGIIGVDRHTGMLIILSKENGKTEYLDIFDVRDKLWDSGVEQAAVTDGGSSVCFWVEGAIKVKGARHYGKSSMNDTVTNYMIFSIR